VREVLDIAFSAVDLDWTKHVEIDPRYYRPAEVDLLLGDATKARERLGWRPRVGFQQLIQMMVEADVDLVKTHIYGAGAKRPSGFSDNQV
jgi:GDPmannose 4,6-dehydratase